MWFTVPRHKMEMPPRDRALPGRAMPMPVPAQHFVNGRPLQPPFPEQMEMALFGLGCFWGAERKFWQAPGVYSTAVGYAAGYTPNPTYEQVCTGRTGHAEVVRVNYDPSVTSYGEILDVFWKAHDPTTLNRQGADRGTQYRSIILTQNDEEAAIAQASKAAAQKSFSAPIVTEITPLTAFYPAEPYHQNFTANNPTHPYVCAVIAPKLEKFRHGTKSA